jgi:hypothetical protein
VIKEDSLTKAHILILTDLDGTLLDATTYSYEAATGALSAIQTLGATLILVSSKTRSEMEPLRLRLDNRHPFIVENGGALFIPMGYFPFPLEQAAPRGDYEVVEIGTPYVRLRTALKEIGGIWAVACEGSGISLSKRCQTSRGCLLRRLCWPPNGNTMSRLLWNRMGWPGTACQQRRQHAACAGPEEAGSII